MQPSRRTILNVFALLALLMPEGAALSGPLSTSKSFEEDTSPAVGNPYIMQLDRESVPVRRNGQIVSYKTTYSGQLSVGGPTAQEFKVVFDTGSGQVVLPSVGCQNATCRREGRQLYNVSSSSTATAINEDGSPVPPGELCDQITIGYGTGEIKGDFAREKICLANGQHLHTDLVDSSDAISKEGLCLDVNIVMAIEMSAQPFLSFDFDGIVGLGLGALSITDDFSFFGLLAGSGKISSKHFGVFLAEGAHGERSEIAFGGHDPKHMVGPLSWAPVPMADMGYWQVEVKGIRFGNQTLDMCTDGSCRGVVDTGSSHLGVPKDLFAELFRGLSVPSGDLENCRDVVAPELEIILDGFVLKLDPENYMRPLPLAPGVNPGSKTAASAEVFAAAGLGPAEPGDTVMKCKPRMMPVNMPAPVGPHLFILGEPVLHRYYSVFDWSKPQIGFALADTPQNKKAKLGLESQSSDTLFMGQMKMVITVTARVSRVRC